MATRNMSCEVQLASWPKTPPVLKSSPLAGCDEQYSSERGVPDAGFLLLLNHKVQPQVTTDSVKAVDVTACIRSTSKRGQLSRSRN